MERRFPIQCADLPQAPANPADDAALVDHLAACPPCASQARFDAALRRLWNASAPVEPSAATWDTLWSRVSDRLDDADTVAPDTGRRPQAITADLPVASWRLHARTAFLVAQAAAILVAFTLWGSHRLKPEAPVQVANTVTTPAIEAPRPATPRLAVVNVEIEAGEVVMIHLTGSKVRAVALGHDEQRPDTIDENLILFNDAEAMAGMQETFAEMQHHAPSAFPPPG